jgi:heme exporter protein D
MNLGPHESFIVASYAVTLVIVVSLIVWVIADHRRQQRALGELETRTGRGAQRGNG